MTKTKKRQGKQHSSHALSIKIKPPPFPPPGTNASSILATNTNQQNWPVVVSFCRYGSKKQFYAFFVRKGSVPLSLRSFSQFLQSNTNEAIQFKKHTNILTPPLPIRQSRQDDKPVRNRSNDVNYMCLFSIKPDNVDGNLCAPYVMKLIKQVLQLKAKTPKRFSIQKKESTQEKVPSLDHLLTDCAIKTFIYYHYYHAELQRYNCDFVRQECVLHAELTNSFCDDCGEEAPFFFSTLNGTYSETAKLFGYSQFLAHCLYFPTLRTRLRSKLARLHTPSTLLCYSSSTDFSFKNTLSSR